MRALSSRSGKRPCLRHTGTTSVGRELNAGGFTFDVSVGSSGNLCHAGDYKDLAEAAAAGAKPGIDSKAGEDIVIQVLEPEFDLIGERRRDRRYECQLPLRYRSSQGRDGGAGTATDISRCGIAVQTAADTDARERGGTDGGLAQQVRSNRKGEAADSGAGAPERFQPNCNSHREA